ncbi:MAG: tetratricopeptide repeat protein, partial [bacterium]
MNLSKTCHMLRNCTGLRGIILIVVALASFSPPICAEPMPPVDYRVYAPFSLLDPNLQQAWDAALKNDLDGADQKIAAYLSSKPSDVLALDLASVLAWEKGDAEKAQELWLRALEAAPSSPITEVFIRRLEFFRGLCPRNPRIEATLERYLKSSQITPLGRVFASEFLLQLKQERLDADGVKKLMSQSGFLTQWQSVVGPFAYTGGSSDLDRPFGPEWDADATSYTLSHRVVAWRPIPEAPVTRSLDVGSLVYPSADIAYLKAIVDAPEETRWPLRVVTSNGYKIYLNGECVARNNPPSDPQSAEQVWLLPLKAGRNALLLKTRSVSAPWEIALQSLDPTVRWVSDSANFPAAAIWNPPLSEGLETFLPSAQQATEYRVFLLHEMDRWRGEGNYSLARRALERLEKAFPDSVLLGNLRGSLALQQSFDQSYSQIRLRNESRGAYESVLTRQPENFRALHGLAQVNLEQRQIDRARELADRLASLKPEHPWVLLLQARVAFEKEWEKELLDALKNPKVQNLANTAPAFLLAQHYARNHVPAAGAGLLKELADHGFATDEILEQGANFSVQADDLETATQFLTPLVERHPNDYGRLVRLGDIYTRLDQEYLARTTYHYAISVNPDAPDAYHSLGNLWSLRGENGLAHEAYTEALRRSPGDVSLREKLRRLAAKETFYAPYDSPPTLDDASTYTAEKYPKADTAWIRDLMVEEIYPDGSSNAFTRASAKLLNKQGRSQWDEIGFSTDRGELIEARAILPDGRILEPESIRVEGSRGAASMFGLVDGAIVDTANTQARGSMQRPQWNGLKTVFTFQRLAAPVALARFVLLVPQGIPLSYETTPPDFAPVETRLGDGRRALVWEKRNLPGIER